LTLICHPVIRRIHIRNAAQAMIDNANSATAASSAGRAEWADGELAQPEGVKASPDVLECHHVAGAWNIS
jgi:predicted transcriptional regulator